MNGLLHLILTCCYIKLNKVKPHIKRFEPIDAGIFSKNDLPKTSLAEVSLNNASFGINNI